jgi:tight adherence protein B
MLVNIELGGNLPAAMEVMSGSLKEIWRLEQKLHTASSEGRKGGMILCVMPLVILVMVILMQPDLLSTLLSSIVGYIVLFVAVVFYLGGLLWMYRILQVDI